MEKARWRESTIYRIICLRTGKAYIGSAMGPVAVRWQAHRRLLETCKHTNRKLQWDWFQFRAGAFRFEVLETVQVTNHSWLLKRERYWIAQQVKQGNCYNKPFSVRRCQECGNRPDTNPRRLPMFRCFCRSKKPQAEGWRTVESISEVVAQKAGESVCGRR